MKIYVAATMEAQARIRQYREPLFQMGHHLISTWLDEQVKPQGMTDKQFNRKMATKDLQEIASSDLLILDLLPRNSAGKFTEFGFALAKHKLVYAVGPQENVSTFVLLADAVFNDWNEVLEHMRTL